MRSKGRPILVGFSGVGHGRLDVVKFSVNIPCFGDFADPRTVGRLAATAEAAGWDGLFVWDHLVHRFHGDRPFGDPWMLLTAAALSTSRLRLGHAGDAGGATTTAGAGASRSRPSTLLSGGRVTLGVGLGGPIDDEYGSFGDTTDPVELARRLDEALPLLPAYWSGRPVSHSGRALHGRGRDPAAADGAAAAGADLGRRLLAEPAADATGRAVGRRGAAVPGAPARRPCHPLELVTRDAVRTSVSNAAPWTGSTSCSAA